MAGMKKKYDHMEIKPDAVFSSRFREIGSFSRNSGGEVRLADFGYFRDVWPRKYQPAGESREFLEDISENATFFWRGTYVVQKITRALKVMF
jgi:hypothetical protein